MLLCHLMFRWLAGRDPNDRVASSSSAVGDPEDPAQLMAQLCACFYSHGWMSGTGGGVSLRCGAAQEAVAYSTASGLQKEDMVGSDMFTIEMQTGV